MANLFFLKRFLATLTFFISISSYCGDTIVDDAIAILEQNSLNAEQVARLQDLVGLKKRKLDEHPEGDVPKRRRVRRAKKAVPNKFKQSIEIGDRGQQLYLSPNSGSKIKSRLLGQDGVSAENGQDGGSEENNQGNIIYTWTAINDHYDEYVEPKDRVELSWLSSPEADIDQALLQVERSIRKWVNENPNIYYRTIYVGLTKNIDKRMYAHRADVKKIDAYGDLIANRKIRLVKNVAKIGFSVRCSKIVSGVPQEHLKTIEVLVGFLFGASDKGNTFLGDGVAYERVSNYLNSRMRKEALEREKLGNVIEEFEDKIFMTTLDIGQETFFPLGDFSNGSSSSTNLEQSEPQMQNRLWQSISFAFRDMSNGIWNRR